MTARTQGVYQESENSDHKRKPACSKIHCPKPKIIKKLGNDMNCFFKHFYLFYLFLISNKVHLNLNGSKIEDGEQTQLEN